MFGVLFEFPDKSVANMPAPAWRERGVCVRICERSCVYVHVGACGEINAAGWDQSNPTESKKSTAGVQSRESAWKLESPHTRIPLALGQDQQKDLWQFWYKNRNWFREKEQDRRKSVPQKDSFFCTRFCAYCEMDSFIKGGRHYLPKACTQACKQMNKSVIQMKRACGRVPVNRLIIANLSHVKRAWVLS